MKKKAFTIIEVLASLFIMMILLSLGVKVGRTIINIKNKIIINNLAYEIKDTLSLSKAYCKRVKEKGRIMIDSKGKYIIFSTESIENKPIKSINMPEGYTVHKSFGSNVWIMITADGYISTAGTITVKENGKDKLKITIAVGNDIITINELDKVEILR